MRYLRYMILVGGLLLLPCALTAQTKKPAVPPRVAINDTDVLGTDDVLDVTVGNHPDLDQTVQINSEGKINLRELGSFTAVGKTRDAIKAEIQTEANKTLNNAPVSVILRERHSRKIFVDGSIAAPGPVELRPGWRVLDAISAGHGLPLKPNRYRAGLIRDGINIPLELTKIYLNPESDSNLLLQPNDRLVFNEIEIVRKRVTVLGQVGRPSTYDVDDETSLLTLLGQAGGLQPAAALTKATVTRGDTVIPLDIRPVIAKGTVDQSILKFQFQNNDVLSIPAVETTYQVLGQVGRPAKYLLPEQSTITVLDALTAAGGPTQSANLKGAVIRRVVNGKPTDVKVDFAALQKKGDASANILIQPNDILIIPERGKRGITLQDVFAPIGLLNILGFRLLGR